MMPPAVLYFAYGSNLCPDQMARRCSGFETVGRAVLMDFRLDFPRRSVRWGGGVAGWIPEPAARLEGALYRLSAVHLEALDRLEGVEEGRYRREEVPVRLDTGEIRPVFSYAARREPGGPFSPTPAYLEAMIRGAAHHGLSAEWIAMLRALRPGSA